MSSVCSGMIWISNVARTLYTLFSFPRIDALFLAGTTLIVVLLCGLGIWYYDS